MSRIDYTWSGATPPKPDVYTTRRNESKYLTLRYWDGARWYEIAFSGTRGGQPFTWPNKSRTPKPRSRFCRTLSFYIRKISAKLGDIQWGEPFKVYDEKEVLAWLVEMGRLPAEWRTCYQREMRGCASHAWHTVRPHQRGGLRAILRHAQ